jgi:hypothetical protein
MVQFRDTLEMLRNDDLSLTSWEFLSSRTKINLSPEIASFDQALRLYSTNAKVDLFDHNRLRDSGMPVKGSKQSARLNRPIRVEPKTFGRGLLFSWISSYADSQLQSMDR